MKKGEMLSKALLIATNAHHGQFDKAGQPYILHCLKTMHYTKSDDEEIQCIALLHDYGEDCCKNVEECKQKLLDAGMSERVIAGVAAMTKQKGQTFEEYKIGVFANVDAIRVKMADLRHNSDIRRLKGVTEKDIQRTVKYHTFYLELEAKLKEL